jgi:hypothetical protein
MRTPLFLIATRLFAALTLIGGASVAAEWISASTKGFGWD